MCKKSFLTNVVQNTTMETYTVYVYYYMHLCILYNIHDH